MYKEEGKRQDKLLVTRVGRKKMMWNTISIYELGADLIAADLLMSGYLYKDVKQHFSKVTAVASKQKM